MDGDLLVRALTAAVAQDRADVFDAVVWEGREYRYTTRRTVDGKSSDGCKLSRHFVGRVGIADDDDTLSSKGTVNMGRLRLGLQTENNAPCPRSHLDPSMSLRAGLCPSV